MTKLLLIIPARAGSVGVWRKNHQAPTGFPLIAEAMDRAAELSERLEQHGITVTTVVSTNDEEIATRTRLWNEWRLLGPSPQTAPLLAPRGPSAEPDAPVHDVVAETVNWLQMQWASHDLEWDLIAIHQVTSPGLTVDTMEDMVLQMADGDADSMATFMPFHGFVWSEHDVEPKERTNRQLQPERWLETGGFQVCSEWPRSDSLFREDGPMIAQDHQPQIVSLAESIDIDTPLDLAAARAAADRPEIAIICHGTHEVGSGHIRRAMMLASQLDAWAWPTIFTIDTPRELRDLIPDRWMAEPMERPTNLRGWGVVFDAADIVVVDVCDHETQMWRGLSDLHPGKAVFLETNMVFPGGDIINGLYGWPLGTSGPAWVDLRDEFLGLPPVVISDTVERALVTFGGTDPAGMTRKMTAALVDAELPWIQVVSPPAGVAALGELADHPAVDVVEDASMPDLLWHADIVFTSCGRTQYEAAHLGTFCVATPVNSREMLMNDSPRGVIRIEFGDGVDPTPADAIEDMVQQVRRSRGERAMLSRTMRYDVDGYGTERIVERVLYKARENRRRRRRLEQLEGDLWN